MILNNEDVLGRVFTHNHEVELMHIALNGLKICHPLPLQAAMITPLLWNALYASKMVSGSAPCASGCPARIPRGYNCTIVAENVVSCWSRYGLDNYASHTSCCSRKRMA